jgi:hypothetical protein
MSVTFQERELVVDGIAVEMLWPILDAFEVGERVIVLFDPDAYLLDPEYRAKRRCGSTANRNLVAFSKDAQKLWEAEFPSASDYYYRISSRTPLRASSFSSYECEIDLATGRIISKTFCK